MQMLASCWWAVRGGGGEHGCAYDNDTRAEKRDDMGGGEAIVDGCPVLYEARS